ncbi:MAG: carbohydrate ABC transporter permease [Chloroflexota bacterium]|nr:carbohydrate ABC transporter permease [Chloroflexota bacterium]MDE2853944.1 carbohydrate ABC transporter permease [Chloroflexota bacterium]MDE2947772.1 carbohydrate ABC transporter permease [Chloroflexota bacterium]
MSSRGVSLSARQIISKIIVYLLLGVGSIIILMPLQWMISTSLKPLSHVFRFPPEFWPQKIIWTNYADALTQLPFDLYFRNTVFIVIFCLLGEVIVSSVVAYAFSRLRWRGRNALFIVVLATMMLPRQVTLIPEFIIFKELDMIDTFWPLILPSWFGNPFYIFLLRQYFLTHSRELDQAAVIDGCSRFGVFWRITLPMSKPVLAAVAIFSFQFHWNDFFRPLIFLFSEENYTLALGLRFFQGTYGTEWNSLMAVSLVVMLPLIVVFFFTQKIFIQGVVFTGYK